MRRVAIIAFSAGVLAVGTWAYGQQQQAQVPLVPFPQPDNVLSGPDIGFRVEGLHQGKLLGPLVVRLKDGSWLEAQFGQPRLRPLHANKGSLSSPHRPCRYVGCHATRWPVAAMLVLCALPRHAEGCPCAQLTLSYVAGRRGRRCGRAESSVWWLHPRTGCTSPKSSRAPARTGSAVDRLGGAAI